METFISWTIVVVLQTIIIFLFGTFGYNLGRSRGYEEGRQSGGRDTVNTVTKYEGSTIDIKA
jgi:hypothetical protein